MSTKHIHRVFDCKSLKEILPDYLDQTLQDKICEQLRIHLEECEDCRIYVKTVETTLILYKHYPEQDVPEEVRIDLRRNLRVKIEEKKDK